MSSAAFAAMAKSDAATSDVAEDAIERDLKAQLGGKLPRVIVLVATPHHASMFAGLAERLSRAFDGAAVVGESPHGCAQQRR